MENYKLQGDFLKHNGRLPKNGRELAEFALFRYNKKEGKKWSY